MSLEDVPSYKENQTAKEPGRPLFNEMMARIEARELNVLYTHEISRLCRNMLDAGRLIHALQKGLIRRIVTPQRTYLPEDNTLLIAIEASVSTEEIRNLTRRVESSIVNKHAKGQYPGKAPVGYMNDLFGIKGDRAILPDPERFEMVRSLWARMLTGAYTVRQLARLARGEGLTTRRYGKTGGGFLSYSALHAMFCNPFYCGLYQWDGEVYPGTHTPMVMVAEFERVQRLLARPSLPRPQSRRRAAEFVPYMGGLLRCGSCGGVITAETHTKTNRAGAVHHYAYLRCTKKSGERCAEPYLTLAEFEEQALDFLQSLSLPDSIARWALEQLKEENALEQRAAADSLHALEEALKQNLAARKRLTDLLLAGRVDEAEYDTRKAEMVRQGQMLNENIARHTDRSNQWLTDVEGAFSFCQSLKQRFAEGSPSEKRLILELVCSNRRIQGKKLLLEPEELFALVRSGNNSGNWRPWLDYVRTIRGDVGADAFSSTEFTPVSNVANSARDGNSSPTSTSSASAIFTRLTAVGLYLPRSTAP